MLQDKDVLTGIESIYIPASPMRRFGAYLYDVLFMFLCSVIPMAVCVLMIDIMGLANTDPLHVVLSIIGGIFYNYGIIIAWIYNINIQGKYGATLGKKRFGIFVLDINGKPIGYFKSFCREIMKNASGCLLFLPIIRILTDKDNQSMYDKALSVTVVQKNKRRLIFPENEKLL